MQDSGLVPVGAALMGAAFLFLAAGCATSVHVDDPGAKLAVWAQARGFVRRPLQAGTFDLLLLTRQSGPAEILTVYIEGDGAPWPTPFHPPRDPTPRNPVALFLAAADASPLVAYLGRPCQYLDAAALVGCDSAYWTDRRFAPEVVSAYDDALTRLKALAGARRVRLIGYSGGGVIASLVAMQRDDLERLVTVAAPLAVGDWVAWHGLSPLTGSLDPRQARVAIGASSRNVHLAGAQDEIVPVAVIEGYVRARGGRLEVVAGFDHDCCWARSWKQILESTIEGRGR